MVENERLWYALEMQIIYRTYRAYLTKDLGGEIRRDGRNLSTFHFHIPCIHHYLSTSLLPSIQAQDSADTNYCLCLGEPFIVLKV